MDRKDTRSSKLGQDQAEENSHVMSYVSPVKTLRGYEIEEVLSVKIIFLKKIG